MAFTLTGTKVEMENTLGANKTMAISKGFQRLLLQELMTFSVGDIIVIDNVSGMNEINKNGKSKTVSTTVSFVAEGLDSTGFSTYTSGGIC